MTTRHEGGEILTIGDELLRGEVVNGNAAWLGARLLECGLPARRVVAVADEPAAIVVAVQEAAARCSLLLITGGLGPTVDDLTAAALAEAIGEGLVSRPELVRAIEQRFAAMNLQYSANNAKQAELPPSATALANACGTAPGLALVVGGCQVFALPGVPAEMRAMFDEHVAPWILARLRRGAVARRTIKLFGIGEGKADAALRNLLAAVAVTDCVTSLHFRTHFPENHVIVVARAEGEAAAAQIRADRAVEALEAEVLRRLERFVFDREGRSFAESLVDALRGAGARVAVAESCTGGRVAELLTGAAGSSAVFELGVVAYADRVKRELLALPAALLAEHGAVSRACAEAMARAVRERAPAEYGLAVTGIAGPDGGSLAKPVGTVHFAVADGRGVSHLQRRLPYDRGRNRLAAAYVALWLLRARLRGEDFNGDDPCGGRWA
ncbi:MAG: CinA family nicotinamide mononucleotide deamidase-related protein [Proteobacteria bacterium]|nr:CinA family nicotinamide mononucleotide deamidase-related protein [Pseudomonadota bacterium]